MFIHYSNANIHDSTLLDCLRSPIFMEYYEGQPDGTSDVENPATGEVESQLLQASRADLDHAVEVAREAQKTWAKVPLAKRVAKGGVSPEQIDGALGFMEAHLAKRQF